MKEKYLEMNIVELEFEKNSNEKMINEKKIVLDEYNKEFKELSEELEKILKNIEPEKLIEAARLSLIKDFVEEKLGNFRKEVEELENILFEIKLQINRRNSSKISENFFETKETEEELFLIECTDEL